MDSPLGFIRGAERDLDDVDKALVLAHAVADEMPENEHTLRVKHFLQMARLDLKAARKQLEWARE